MCTKPSRQVQPSTFLNFPLKLSSAGRRVPPGRTEEESQKQKKNAVVAASLRYRHTYTTERLRPLSEPNVAQLNCTISTNMSENLAAYLGQYVLSSPPGVASAASAELTGTPSPPLDIEKRLERITRLFSKDVASPPPRSPGADISNMSTSSVEAVRRRMAKSVSYMLHVVEHASDTYVGSWFLCAASLGVPGAHPLHPPLSADFSRVSVYAREDGAQLGDEDDDEVRRNAAALPYAPPLF